MAVRSINQEVYMYPVFTFQRIVYLCNSDTFDNALSMFILSSNPNIFVIFINIKYVWRNCSHQTEEKISIYIKFCSWKSVNITLVLKIIYRCTKTGFPLYSFSISVNTFVIDIAHVTKYGQNLPLLFIQNDYHSLCMVLKEKEWGNICANLSWNVLKFFLIRKLIWNHGSIQYIHIPGED